MSSSVSDQLQQRLWTLERLDRVHSADGDSLTLTEPKQRLPVGRKDPPDGLLPVTVEVGIDADVARYSAPDGLVVLRAVIVLFTHGETV